MTKKSFEDRVIAGELVPRSEVPLNHTWDLTRFYSSTEDWEKAYQDIKRDIPKLGTFEGRLGESAKTLHDYYVLYSDIIARFEQLQIYAHLSHDSDTNEPAALERLERSAALEVEFDTATSFDEPEILKVGEKAIFGFIAQLPELKEYEFILRELFRLAPHVRSAEVEEVVALAGELCHMPENIYQKLNDTDLRFDPLTIEGKVNEIGQGNLEVFTASSDRQLRKVAYENYGKSYCAFENTFAACLAGEVKKSVFLAQVQKYSSTLDAALAPMNIPSSVFFNTIDTVRKNFPIWHRYWKVRARALGLQSLAPYDIHAPLSPQPPKILYDQAVRYLIEGMQPLGDEYCTPLTRGLTTERWVDVFPNQGKRSNAYSSGAYNVSPFVLMNFGGTLSEMSTLAHELGHAMHSYFAQKSQNFLNHDYTLFVAEVASNFNQAMVRDRLLQNPDRNFQLAVLDEAFYNFHRYLFTMPILARFEYEVHSRVENGEGITAEFLKELMARLLQEGYGDGVKIDQNPTGMMWAQFGHLYSPYYVFQYTTGISAANALAKKVIRGEAGAVKNYLGMLKAGGSKNSLDILRDAGVDMVSPEPIQQAFVVLSSFIDRLEKLIAS